MAMMKQLLFVALVVLIVAVSFSMVEAAQPYTTYPPRILRRIREAAEAMNYPKHN
uniref:Uncharacterized protein n=3 Tax=gambiae species complex TaxID=44542 RepID=A0A1S4HCN5_ANOGA